MTTSRDNTASRFLVLGKFYPPEYGGIETMTQKFAQWASYRATVTVLASTFRHSSMEYDGSIQVLRRNAIYRILSQPITPTYFSRINISEYRYVHLHSPNPLVAISLARRIPHLPTETKLIITHHADIVGREPLRTLYQHIYRLLLRRADLVTFTSLRNVPDYMNDLPNTRLAVLPPSVPNATTSQTRAVIGFSTQKARSASERPLKVGMLCRHSRYKGIEVLLQALCILPSVHATIVGDGPLFLQHTELAKTLGLDNRVSFVRSINEEEKRSFFSSIDVFAFPSTDRTEAFGIAQLEAMAYGCPVVSTNLRTGVQDLAIHGHTALLAEPNNALSLAYAINEVAKDPSSTKERVLNALSLVESSYTDSIVKGHFYSSIFGSQ